MQYEDNTTCFMYIRVSLRSYTSMVPGTSYTTTIVNLVKSCLAGARIIRISKYSCDIYYACTRLFCSSQVLAVLKVLGGGNCFRDISGFSRMSRQTAESSFHHFCEKFSEGLWESWVYLPESEELQKVRKSRKSTASVVIPVPCGYPGAMGSVDCTHFK